MNSLPRTQAPLAARDREKSFVAYFGAGMSGSGTVNRPGRAQDTNQVCHIYIYIYVQDL